MSSHYDFICTKCNFDEEHEDIDKPCGFQKEATWEVIPSTCSFVFGEGITIIGLSRVKRVHTGEFMYAISMRAAKTARVVGDKIPKDVETGPPDATMAFPTLDQALDVYSAMLPGSNRENLKAAFISGDRDS